jgi:methoxymalonate biosynthesis acyl carrier protein
MNEAANTGRRVDDSVVRQKVRAFIMAAARLRELNDEAELFRRGAVNSLLAAQLVMFVEREFQIRMEGGDLKLGNFRNVNCITELVARKLNT